MLTLKLFVYTVVIFFVSLFILGTNNSYNGLAIRRFSPLNHLSQLKKG